MPPALAGKYFTAEPLGKPKHYSSDINEVTFLQLAIAMCTTQLKFCIFSYYYTKKKCFPI